MSVYITRWYAILFHSIRPAIYAVHSLFQIIVCVKMLEINIFVIKSMYTHAGVAHFRWFCTFPSIVLLLIGFLWHFIADGDFQLTHTYETRLHIWVFGMKGNTFIDHTFIPVRCIKYRPRWMQNTWCFFFALSLAIY